MKTRVGFEPAEVHYLGALVDRRIKFLEGRLALAVGNRASRYWRVKEPEWRWEHAALVSIRRKFCKA